jgi:hypothetical protein
VGSGAAEARESGGGEGEWGGEGEGQRWRRQAAVGSGAAEPRDSGGGDERRWERSGGREGEVSAEWIGRRRASVRTIIEERGGTAG